MKGKTTIVLFATMTLVGCLDMGLEGNRPLEEAEQAPPSELVAAVSPAADVAERELIADGRLWVPTGLPATLQLEQLRPIGAAAGQTVYARGWDQAPYDEIFTRVEERDDPLRLDPWAPRWQSYESVIGGGAPRPTATAGHGH